MVNWILARAQRLEPGIFALVMATGIVSIDAGEHALPLVADGLLVLNLAAYGWLLVLLALRIVLFRAELIADFLAPGRGAGFLTLAAGTAVVGTQCLTVVNWPTVALILALAGAAFWLVLIYLFFAASIVRRIKPGFTRSINGAWLVAVVATQSLAVLVMLLAARLSAPGRDNWLFAGLCLYMLGAALYLLIITLVVYRMVFFPLRAREFTPPYWIDMGALAITSLAGATFALHAPAGGPLGELVPFVKGFSLFFWATATWWIPLLVILEIWRHAWRHVPLAYETDDWDIVFPVGMYTVCTWTLARALGLGALLWIPAIGVYLSLAVWATVAFGLLRRLAGSRPARAHGDE